MMNLIRRLTQLRGHYPDLIERQQAQRLLITNLVWIGVVVVAFPWLILWVVQRQALDTPTVYAFITILVGVIVHQQLQNNQLERARWLFVLNMMAASLLANFPDYRIDSPFIILLILPVIAAGVLLPRAGLVNVVIVLTLIVTVGGLIQLNSGMDPSPIGSDFESVSVTILLVVSVSIISTLLLSIFASSSSYVIRQRQDITALVNIVSRISTTLVEVPGSEDRLNRAVEELRDALGLYHVQVFLADAHTGMGVLHASTGFIGRRLLEKDSLNTPDENSPVNDALRRKTPVLLQADTGPQPVSFLPATQSELLLPLRVGNLMPLGVLDLHSTAYDTFSEDLQHAMITLSNHMAAALYSSQQIADLKACYAENNQLIEQLDASQRELSRLNRQLISTTWGEYFAERPDTALGYEWRDRTIQPQPVDTDSLNRALADGQPHLEKAEVGDVLSVPIRLRGQTLGAIEFRREGVQHWTPSALEMAQAVADRLALALENARLFEQTQTTAQREQLVSSVMSELQTTTNLQTLIALAAREFQQALGATHTRVRLGLAPDTAPETPHGDDQDAV